MRSEKDIINLVKEFKVTPPAEQKNAVLAEALRLQQSRGSVTSGSYIMNHKLTSIAAALVIIIGVFFALNRGGVPIDGATVAWGKMIEQMRLQKWIYVYFDNGSGSRDCQWWISPEKKVLIEDQNGRVTYKDYTTDEVWCYYKDRNEIEIVARISDGLDIDFKDGKVIDSIFNRPYQELEALRRYIAYNNNPEPLVSDGIYRGHNVKIYKYKAKDEKLNLGDDKCWLTMYIDAESEMLRGYTMWSHRYLGPDLKTSEYIGVERREHAYDYPEPGPESIYDVGVPRDAKVINRIDREFLALREKYYQVREKAFANIICLSDSNRFGNRVGYYRGEKYLDIRYFGELDLQNGTATGLHNINMQDENGTFSITEFKGELHVSEGSDTRHSKKGDLHEYAWPDIDIKASIIKDDYSVANNLIGVECIYKISGQEKDDVFRFYLNPARNYICHRLNCIWGDGNLLTREVTDYVKVNDLWYPAKVEHYSGAQPDNREYREYINFTYDNKIKINDSLFNIEKAKKKYTAIMNKQINK